MDEKKEFLNIMRTQSELALATSTYNRPNVRVVNFLYDEEKTGIIYFASFESRTKIKEFEINPKIAFTTLPKSGRSHIKAKGEVRRSNYTISDLAERFIAKVPHYKDMIEHGADQLAVFEIHFEKAAMTLEGMYGPAIEWNKLVEDNGTF